MTNTLTQPTTSPSVVAAGDGDHLHFLNHLATVKASAHQTGSAINAVEFTAPRGFGPPLHVHHEEDELMYLVDGQIRFRAAGDETLATTGAVVILPAGIPHTFQVESTTARFLTIAAGSRQRPTFDRFVSTLGTPAATPTLPAPVDIDPGRVADVGAAHGIEILGPPPAPLD